MKNNEGNLENICVDLLRSNLKYQRDIDYDFVKRIATNWDWGKFDVPCVSFRDGMYNIIEGQHTVAAAKMKFGLSREIPCKVKFDLTEVDESLWFYEETKKKTKQSLSAIYNARLLGNDQDLISLVDDLKITGLKLKIGITAGRDVITPISTVEKIYSEMNNIEFISCLKLLKDTWDGNKDSLSAAFIKGMIKFYQTYSSEFDAERFINVLSKVDPKDIKHETKSDVFNNDTPIKYGKVFCKYYNKGMDRSKKLKIGKLDD